MVESCWREAQSKTEGKGLREKQQRKEKPMIYKRGKTVSVI
jgi:hypothetical protein